MNTLLIKNATVVNDDSIQENVAVFVKNGIIEYIGKEESFKIPKETRVINAEGKYVIPGGIDPHTHLEMELEGVTTADDYYQGSVAAVAGGTTTFIDFIIPKKGQSLVSAFDDWLNRASKKAICNFAFHCAITWWSPSVRDDMKILCEKGVNSFKMYMAYKDVLMLNDGELYETFERCREIGALAQVHAENGEIIEKNTVKLLAKGVTGPEGHQMSRTEDVEAEAVNRACTIANQTGCPLYVVHVMSASAAEEVRRARERWGNRFIFGEALASGLGVDGRHYYHKCWRHAAGYIMSPPLRPDEETKTVLMRMLAGNHLQTTGSDNCTYNKEQKELGRHDFSKIPNGINGLEDRMSVVWEKGVHSGIIDAQKFVAVTSTNAAKIFNIFPRKGRISVGSDADLVIWNHKRTRTISSKTHHHAVDFNIFEGMECHGVPEVVIVAGNVCFENGELKAQPGSGKFLKTPAFNPYIYDSIRSPV